MVNITLYGVWYDEKYSLQCTAVRQGSARQGFQTDLNLCRVMGKKLDFLESGFESPKQNPIKPFKGTMLLHLGKFSN